MLTRVVSILMAKLVTLSPFGLTQTKQLSHHHIIGGLSSMHSLQLVEDTGYGGICPKLLTASARGPLRDLEIQFLTIDSGNLVWPL